MGQVERQHMTADFAGSVWCLKMGDGRLLSPVVHLLRNGAIGGHIHDLHRRWVFQDGKLFLLDIDGVVTTIFDRSEDLGDNGMRFKGHMRSEPSLEVMLDRAKMPSFKDIQAEENLSFIKRIDRPLRDHVVVVCANDKSLHTQWPKDIDESDRNWDLCVTRYDLDKPEPDESCEYLAHQPRKPKFAAIYNLFYPGSPLWDYKYIWLPDDDLMTTRRAINRMFELCMRHQLLLAQPSLVAESYINHFITKQDRQFSLRFTKFVELMCPVFSQEALQTCLPTFQSTVSAYGLDHIWPRLLGGISSKVAIIDTVAVAHTRPLGKNYDVQGAIAEGLHMQKLYAAPASYKIVGGMLQGETDFV